MTEQEKREKVIKGLECIRDWSQFAVNKRWLVAGATEKMVKYAEDALKLLKAQEPVEAKIGGSADNCWWYTCGGCGEAIDHIDRYCRHCGRAVKWG